MIHRAGAIAVGVAFSVVLAFALAWLVEQVPVAGIVVYFAAIAGLGWTIWKVAASEQPLRSALMVGVTFGCSFALVALLSVVLANDTGNVDAVASAASTSSTSPNSSSSVVASTAGPDGARPAVGPPDSSGPAPTAATPTTTTVPGSAVPPPAPTTTAVPPPAPTTTAAPPPPLQLSVVDPADCDCGPGDELTGLGVRLTDSGDGVVIDVGTAGENTGPVWLWRLDAPGEPVVVDVAADAEPRDGGWSIRLDGVGAGPWAAVSSGGDRVPDVGFVMPGGVVADTSSTGVLAARFERDLAEVQQAVPRLDDDVAGLVASLTARQVLTGTVTFRRTAAADGSEVTVEVVNEWPRFSQSVTAAGEEVQSLYATADEVVVCVPTTGGHDCSSLDAVVPLVAALSIVRDPGALVLEPADDGEYDGRPTTCVRIVEVPDNGPSLGLTCWLANGMSSRSVRDGIDTIELVSITSDVDPARLEPPGDG